MQWIVEQQNRDGSFNEPGMILHKAMQVSSDIFHITYVYSLWQDLSMRTKIFDLVTLTLKFDLF